MSYIDPPQRTEPSDTADNRDHWSEVGELLASLYRIVDRLEALFPGRKFTPDGHLVGSIGEVISARLFRLELLPASAPDHDAITADGRRVQIKFTQGTRGVALRAEPGLSPRPPFGPRPLSRGGLQRKGQVALVPIGQDAEQRPTPDSLARLRAINRDVAERERLDPCGMIDLALRTTP